MVLKTERTALYQEINRRVFNMLDNGWLSEVETLLGAGITKDMPSFRALGYAELADVITGGLSLSEAAETIARKTRNYAKRQNTWFKGMKNAFFTDRQEMEEELWRCIVRDR
jgi:tRNA dimethylallyltransferase